MPEKCKYENLYFDYDSDEFKTYKCEEDVVKDGLCIFHHKKYWEENKDEVRKKFMEKVKNAIKNKEPLLCIGYNLSKVDLSKIKFEIPVYFLNTVFHEEVYFSFVEFNREVDFRGATFLSDADFFKATFLSKADFSEAKFSSNADFIRTKFLSEAIFSGVTFLSKADFSEAKFLSEAYFSEAKFSSNADFIRTKFLSKVYFRGTKFLSKINFRRTKFSSEVFFRVAIFLSETLFIRTKFLSKVYFRGTKFLSKVYFTRAGFSGAVVFREAKFLGKTLFDYSTFLDAVYFVNPDFSPGVIEKCLEPYSCILFRYSNFKKQEKVMFIGCNMERISFIHTNIERVRFRNVEWGDFRIYDEKLLLLKESKEERKKFIENGKRKLKEISNVSKEKILEILIGKSNANKIEEEIVKVLELKIPEVLDEIKWLMVKEKTKDEEDKLNKLLREFENEVDKIIKEAEKVINMGNKEIEYNILNDIILDEDLVLDNVLAVYRALRENYDYYLKYDESGKFFINEMKLKKRFSNFTEKIVLSIYELLCIYGESYRRTIAWILATILLFALARLLFEASPLSLDINSLIDSLNNSIAAFFQLSNKDDPLTIMERVASIPILGTFIIALRRKLERRIRH